MSPSRRLPPSPLLLLTPLLLVLAPAGCRTAGFPDYPEGYREFAYVANATGNTVSVLDLVYLRPERTLQVGADPVALASSPDPRRDEVYVLNAQPDAPNGTLSVLDTAHNTIAATIPLHRDPTAFSIDPTGHRAYVANTGSNSVSVVDLDTRRVLTSVATGDKPAQALLSPDGRTLVVANRASGTVELFAVALPASSGPPLALRSSFVGCSGASSIVVLPDSSKAFVACSGSDRVLALALAAAPGSWAVRQDASAGRDHALALLQVGDDPASLTLKPDGGEIFVSNAGSNSVSEIATQTNEVGSTYAIGNHPAQGIVQADNSALWIAATGADSISLYSIDDGKFVSSLRTGAAPGALAFSADQHLLLAADRGSGDVAIIRTASKLGPALFTILPAGGQPSAIVVRAMQTRP